MQLIGMGVVTMVFAVLGFLSPANRGGLMTAMLLLFVFMGIFGGYYSARLYKLFKVRHAFRLSAGTGSATAQNVLQSTRGKQHSKLAVSHTFPPSSGGKTQQASTEKAIIKWHVY